MNKVFAITCHKMTNPLIHTVEYLSSFAENIVLIHVDKKTNIKGFLKLTGSNVHVIPNRVDVTWGHVSQINSVLALMRFSLDFQYDYFFLLSGDDIPLKSNAELDGFLTLFSNYNFIHYQDTDAINPENRVKYSYPDFFHKKNKSIFTRFKKIFVYSFRNPFFRNKIFYNSKYKIPKMYKGTGWFGLKKETIDYILDYFDKNPWFLNLFDKSICGDEVVFHTIIKTNADLRVFDNIDYRHKALRYIDWESGPEYPKILEEEDKIKMKASNYFFARKVDENASKEFMNYFLD